MNRRNFVQNSLMATAAVMTTPAMAIPASGISARSFKTGIMWGTIGVGNSIAEKFRLVKNAGFDGIEVYSHLDRSEVLEAKEATGLAIPTVCGALHGRYPLSDPDTAVRAQGVDALKTTLEDAAIYGAESILLVPGRVSKEVAYDDCWHRSVDEIHKVLPLAEQLKVKIAIENVWNNFLLSPMEAARYVDQFDSKWVSFYFDCGNILFLGWPEQWIKILGSRISNIHIKEYSNRIADSQGKRHGFDVKLLEGDVDWRAVMAAIDEIGYSGWTILEQSGGDTPEGLADLHTRLLKIHAQ